MEAWFLGVWFLPLCSSEEEKQAGWATGRSYEGIRERLGSLALAFDNLLQHNLFLSCGAHVWNCSTNTMLTQQAKWRWLKMDFALNMTEVIEDIKTVIKLK